MNLRRDLELWTFNIVETGIDYGEFVSSTKCVLHYGMFRYAPPQTHIFKQTYGGQGVGCGLYMLGPGSHTIWRNGPVGVGVSLWAISQRPSP